MFVVVRPGKDTKIKNGYPWIFHDELEDVVGDPESGDVVNVFSHGMEFLGRAFYGSRIRMLTREDEEIDLEFLRRRIHRADRRRKFLLYYRMVHGEADALPGLIVDRYGDGFVVQIRNRGMERLRDDIVRILVEDFGARFVHERSDFESDPGEEIERRNETLYGEAPEEIEIVESEIRFLVNVKSGQKTGFFYDQRANRPRIRKMKGEKALDLYTYTGGFALNMAASGMEVTGVDISEPDLELARKNAKINGLKVRFVRADALEYLESTREEYDLVVADPPSLIKKKSERGKGIKLFSKLVSGISRVLRNGGTMVLCTCAYHMDIGSMIHAMRSGLEGKRAVWRIFDLTFQDADHPWIAQIPETLYLKCFWAKLEEGF